MGEKYYEKYGFNVASSEVSEESNEEAKKLKDLEETKELLKKLEALKKKNELTRQALSEWKIFLTYTHTSK